MKPQRGGDERKNGDDVLPKQGTAGDEFARFNSTLKARAIFFWYAAFLFS